jgi:hypothetical protein
MRSLTPLVVSASLLFVPGVLAQSLTEHAAAAAGATIGVAAGKPVSNAITKIFGSVDSDTNKAAGQKAIVKTQPKPEAKAEPKATTPVLSSQTLPSPNSPNQSVGSPRSNYYESRRRTTAPQATQSSAALYTVQVPPEPQQKEPTAEELASIKVGATEKEMMATLGPPESRVTIPDDGHLIEICQYWAKGKQLATYRLDNGQVVNVTTL